MEQEDSRASKRVLEARPEMREGFKEQVLISGTFGMGSHGDAGGGVPGRRRWGV